MGRGNAPFFIADPLRQAQGTNAPVGEPAEPTDSGMSPLLDTAESIRP